MKLKNDLIKVSNEILDWKTAIEQGVDLLVENEICTNQFATEIINSVLEFGPYFILMPKLALAHAAPGEYTKENGLSLIVFKNDVLFSENVKHNVNLLFTLSAKDGNSHIELLTKFATLFQEDSNLVNKIYSCDDVEEIKIKLKGLF